MMSDELVCPNSACGAQLNERQFLTTTLTVEACPRCRTEVRRSEGFRWENRDAIILEDVTYLQEWLEAVGQSMSLRVTRRPDEESQGRYRWEAAGGEGAVGSLPWTCSVEYSASTPHICEVRLTSEQGSLAVTSDPGRLRAVCDDHAVQPHGSRTSGWDWQRGEHAEARWGVRLFLMLGTLSEGLFRAVVRRLDAAMRDATTQFEAGKSV